MAEVYQQHKQPIQAYQHYQKALHQLGQGNSEQHAELLTNMANSLDDCYHYAKAETAYRASLNIRPNDSHTLTCFANNLVAQTRYDEAKVIYEMLIEREPEQAHHYTNLGSIYQAKGEHGKALAYNQHALKLDPTLMSVWNNLVACMTYDPSKTAQDLRQALSTYDQVLVQPKIDPRPHTNDRSPNRRLKVGYVSADFRKHAVAYFALPLIENHSDSVEVYAYYNHLQQDAWTQAFQNSVSHWRHIITDSDEKMAQRIRDDGIDILVDLTGHTQGNRLGVFAQKPAPVQVTWMGYVTTTGQSTMDWRITHQDADPLGVEDDYSEQLYRLKGTMWCYRPLPDMPAVQDTPALSNGYVTFGSFNRYSKNNPQVIQVWIQLLAQLPTARLLICIPEGQIRTDFLLHCQTQGIDPARIDCFAKVDHATFWQLHQQVDIALDPFPFGGGTTTCETLWMGVPIVTCTGEATSSDESFVWRFSSRMGYAFLNNIGLGELASSNLNDYRAKLVHLSQDIQALNKLRHSIRPKMAQSPLTDEQRFAQEMEQAYRDMWQAWVGQQAEQ